MYAFKPPPHRNKDEKTKRKKHNHKTQSSHCWQPCTKAPLSLKERKIIDCSWHIIHFYSVETEKEICNLNHWVSSEQQELSWLAFSQCNCYFLSCWKSIFITVVQTGHVKPQRNLDFTAVGGSKYLHLILRGSSRNWLCSGSTTASTSRENRLSNTCLWLILVSSWPFTSVKTWKKTILNKNLMALNTGKIYLLLWN